MSEWSALDWIGYACIGIAAIMPALGLAMTAENLAGRLVSSRLWKIVPAMAFILSALIFSGTELGLWNPKSAFGGCNNTLNSDFIQSWNFVQPIAEASIDSSKLMAYRDKYNLLLIGRFAYADVDEMTDQAIAISRPYTITGQPFMLAAADYKKLRVSSSSGNLLDFYVLVIPKDVTPDQIHSLANATAIGGIILGRRSIGLPPFPAPAPQPQPPKTP